MSNKPISYSTRLIWRNLFLHEYEPRIQKIVQFRELVSKRETLQKIRKAHLSKIGELLEAGFSASKVQKAANRVNIQIRKVSDEIQRQKQKHPDIASPDSLSKIYRLIDARTEEKVKALGERTPVISLFN